MEEDEFYKDKRIQQGVLKAALGQGVGIPGSNGEPLLKGVKAKVDTNINQKQREEMNQKKTVMQLEKER